MQNLQKKTRHSVLIQDVYKRQLDEVMNIQREGREKRREAEAELRNMENELKAKLLEIRG